MTFDISTAKPMGSGGFDLSTANPVTTSDLRLVGIPNDFAAPEPQKQDKGFLSKAIDRVIGSYETPLAIATGMVGAVGGTMAALPRLLTQGQESANESMRGVQSALTYRPRTESGQSDMAHIADFMDFLKVPPLPINPGTAALSSLAPRQAAQGANRMVDAAKTAIRGPEPQMAGVGSALTDVERIRAERAAQLPVPMKLTKGMLSRDFEQQRFERETAKAGAIGEPIRERHADLNQQILQNFDEWVDQTGSTSGQGLRATGQVVNDSIVAKSMKAKAEINAAYERARKAGETASPVNVSPLVDYVKARAPEAINAPIISSVEAKIKQLSKNNEFGQPVLALNDLEEVRKMVGALSGKDATNAHFGKELKSVIDTMTDGVGGVEYQRARKLRTLYGKEFEDVGVIDKMLRTKPGTKDRAVAYEDVFKHSILSGSLDDVRSVRRTLQTAGKEGEQAWRELQGQTVQHMKDKMTENSARDMRGNPVASAAKLDRVVRELDADGKLDFIFGKQGASQIRAINETAKDVLTFPPGSVNTSGTASVLLDALGSAAMGRLPTAAAQAIAAVKGLRDSRKIKVKVNQALNPEANLTIPAQRDGNRLLQLLQNQGQQ